MADAPGTTLTCAQCGAVSPADQRFCGSCGAKLVAGVGASPTALGTSLPNPLSVPERGSERPETNRSPSVPSGLPLSGTERGLGGEVPGASNASPLSRPALTKAVGLPDTPTRSADPARERDRLLTLANVQRVRGQLAEARKTVDTVLDLSEGLPNRELAPIHELRGDLLQAEGKWEEAQAAFEKAHNLDTERVGAEKKFAEATLRIGEARAIASGSMLGLGNDGFGGMDLSRRKTTTKPGIAVIASLFVPGFGQLVNGEMVKAGVCLGVFLLTLVALCLSPDSVILFAKINALVSPNGPAAARALDPLSPLMIALLILLAVDWGYSLFDAAAASAKTGENVSANAPPAGDRSGWEV